MTTPNQETDVLVVPSPTQAGSDQTPVLRNLLDRVRAGGIRRLVFAPGVHDFYPDRATEAYLFIANNDEGLKRVVFPLEGLKDFEVDGAGAEFRFHGLVIPFLVRDCVRVTLRGFTIDWARSFHAEAEVLRVDRESVDLRLAAEFSHEVAENGQFRLVYGDGRPACGIHNLLEFDAARCETAWLAQDNYLIGERSRAEVLGPGTVRLHARLSRPLPKPGNILAIMPRGRFCPAIVLDRSDATRIEEVTIHHAGGMGVIAQRCRGVTLSRVQVRAREGGGRLIATAADATHFVGCGGRVTVEDCRFEGQMDDPLNIHGVYARITARPAPDAVEIELCHGQQQGFELARAGERVEVVDRHTLLTKHEVAVAAVERVNRRFTVLRFAGPLPDTVKVGDGVGNLDWAAELVIRRTRCAANRARGLLVSTAGRVLIEDNHFHVPGAAILIAGDANFWFESGAVGDVTIRGNHFDRCGHGVWGRAAIDINPEIEPAHRRGTRYHRSIVIEGNRFTAFDRRIVRGHCTEGVTIRGNRIEHSEAYPARNDGAPLFELTDCGGVTIADNHVAPEFAEPHATVSG